MGFDRSPALMGLTLYVGLGGLTLGIEGVEVLFEAMLGRLPGVNCAAEELSSPHAGGRGVRSWRRDLERSRPLDRHNEPRLVAGAKKRELERSVDNETSLDVDYVTNK